MNESNSEQENSLEYWKEKYNAELKYRVQIEDDCDLLAVENQRLLSEVRQLRDRLLTYEPLPPPPTIEESETQSRNGAVVNTAYTIDAVVDGDGKFANTVKCKIEKACGDKNCLSVAFAVSPFHNSIDCPDLILCGGVDNCLSAYDLEVPSKKVFSYPGSAPVLAIDCVSNNYNALAAYSMMDGSHAIVSLYTNVNHTEDASLHSIVRFKDHNKYVVSIKWSPDGSLLATTSHDKTVNLYRNKGCLLGSIDMEKITCFSFAVTPESSVFVKSASSSAYELVIALRDSLHLLYINCETLQQRKVALNANDWDQHISFTPLHLSVSPDNEKLLTVSTDNHLLIVQETGTNRRVCTFGGHNCGPYGKPRVCWDPTGNYLYANSEEESYVYVYSLATGKLAETLTRGHRGVVKDIAVYPSTNKRLLLTASFDHSVNLWERPGF